MTTPSSAPTSVANPTPTGTPSACADAAAASVRRSSAYLGHDARSGRPFHKVLPATLLPVAGLSASAAGGGDVICHGGPIQPAPTFYLVFWGAAWMDTSATGGDPDGMKATVLRFARALGGSRWLNTTTQYFDPRGEFVGNGPALAGGELDDAGAPPAVPEPADLAAEAAKAAAHFGDYSVNANYFVLTPHGVVPAGFGTAYCAWHSYAPAGGGSVPFTNLPYLPDGGPGCGANMANSGPSGLLDGVSMVLGHEQAETETDPFIDAWYDAAGAEIADKCVWLDIADNPNAGGFPTQPLWSNRSSGCVQYY